MKAFLKNIFCLIISSLFIYGQMASADIAIISGANQTIQVGAPSAQIIVKVTDSTGNPSVGTPVNFSLSDPDGYSDNERLVIQTGNTNDIGEIDTIMKLSEITGTYTLTATVANDSTQMISTELQVTVGDAFSATVQEGDHQKITKGKFSEDIVFQIRDSFGNIIKGEAVDFKLENSDGEIIDNGLTLSSDISDENALVSTRVNNILTQEGIYTILASFPEKVANVGSATIEVLPSLPDLPALGFGSLVNANGVFLNSTARFYGGISINGNPFEQEVVKKVSSEDQIVVQAAITTDDNHIEESFDILVVASYKAHPFSTDEEQFFVVLDNAGTVQPWKLMDMENLVPFKEDVALFRNSTIEIFRGQLTISGLIRLYFAYRLSDGSVVFNSDLTINLLLEE